MKKYHFFEIALIIFLGVSVFLNWKFYSNQNINLDTENKEQNSQIEKEDPWLDLDQYEGSVLQIGGIGSKITQASAWILTEVGYLSPAEDWIKSYFNTPGDIMFVSCKDGYFIVSCKSSSGNQILPSSDKTTCNIGIENKMQNWALIKCALN